MPNHKYFPDYQSKIIERFYPDYMACGSDLSSIGELISCETAQIDIQNDTIFNPDDLTVHFVRAVEFIESKKAGIWFRVLYPDDAINIFVGVGILDTKQNWKSFVLSYFNTHQAEEGGGGALVIFDFQFEWAVEFEMYLNLKTSNLEFEAHIYQKS